MNNKTTRMLAVFMASVICLSMAACSRGAESSSSGSPSSSGAQLGAWENPLQAPRPDSGYVPQAPDVAAKIKEMETKNADTVGWLTVPGTEIDDVVVQTKDNEYYYRKDALKNYSFAGSIWMDYESGIGDGTAKGLSQNTILYGHNLGKPQGVKDDPDGEKFAQLFKFEDIEFAKKHPYFYFSTEEETHIYEIFTIFYSEDDLSPVPYHYASYAPDQFEKLIADVRNRSQYDYNSTLSPSDKIMTLSTCTYKYGTYSQNPHQRYVVMGRLVQNGESFYEAADLQVNPDPKAPQFK